MALDLDFLSSQAGVSQEFTLRMLSIFERQTPALLDDLGTALDAGDPQGVHRVAHKLKSSAAMLGLHEAVAALKTLEEVTSQGQFPANGGALGRAAVDASRRALAGVQQARTQLDDKNGDP
jgi:HPt (histidine-containing phosphotransfer) domain-containing protein